MALLVAIFRAILQALVSFMLLFAAVQGLRGALVVANDPSRSPSDVLILCGAITIVSSVMFLASQSRASPGPGKRFSGLLCASAASMSAVGLMLPLGMLVQGFILAGPWRRFHSWVDGV